MLRYYFDEHVDPDIAEQLRKRGIDVLTTQEAGRANQKFDDPDQLAYATSLERVIVTKDHRFEVLAYTQRPHPGIIRLQKDDSLGRYIEFLETIALALEPEEVANRLTYYDW